VARIRRAKVGADGRFELAGCSAPPYRLELYAATDRPLVRLEGVGPGPEIELEVEPLGSIQGEFVDEAGLLPPSVLPDIYLGVQEYVGPTWSEHGRFDFEQLRPGRYRLTIEHDEHLLFTRWVDLAPGEHVDLGRIASVPLGSLLVDFDTYPSGGITGSVLDEGLGLVAVIDSVDGRLGVRALPPGEWRLDLEAQGCARISAPFTVRPGERTDHRLTAVPGVDRS